MRIAVVGLGGVGGYLAAKFAQAKLDVTGFGRGKHLEVIKKEGLRVVEDAETYTVFLRVASLQEAQGSFDCVFFCVKSYDLAEAYKTFASHITKKTLVLSLSNGVNNAELLHSLGAPHVLKGAVYILAHLEGAGIVRKKGEVFAAVFGGENSKNVEKIAHIFQQANLRYKTPENIEEGLWKKYIFIAAFATLTSYYNKPIVKVYEKHYKEAEALLQEIAAVAKHYGINIDAEVPKALQTAAKLPSSATTSMHKDFQDNKQTELEALSGFVAKTQGVATPLMAKMYGALKQRI